MNRKLFLAASVVLCAALPFCLVVSAAGADVTQTENLTVKTDETPRLRLEQTGGELPAQSWDLAGNQTSFFIRDHTHGDTLPFQIFPEAPTDNLTVADGRVGIGVANPSATAAALQINAYGEARTVYSDYGNPNAHPVWSSGIPTGQNAFAIGPNDYPPILTLRPSGDAELAGSLGEDANTGTVAEVQNVNSQEILAKVAALPIRSWRFSGAPTDDRHLGPLADYFGPAFGLGDNPRLISPSDVAGVSLSAVQGLVAKNQTLESSVRGTTEANQSLSRRVGNLAKQLKSLRKLVKKLGR